MSKKVTNISVMSINAIFYHEISYQKIELRQASLRDIWEEINMNKLFQQKWNQDWWTKKSEYQQRLNSVKLFNDHLSGPSMACCQIRQYVAHRIMHHREEF